MNKLLNMNQWETRYGDFCKRHAWLSYQKNFSSAPGWLNLIDACLNDIEEVLLPIGLENLIFFGLVIRNGNDKEMNIYADFNAAIGAARVALCKDIVKQAINLSSGICFKCGASLAETEDEFGHRARRACEAHAAFEGVFAEEYYDWDVARIIALCNQASYGPDEDDYPSENTVEGKQDAKTSMTGVEKPVIDASVSFFSSTVFALG